MDASKTGRGKSSERVASQTRAKVVGSKSRCKYPPCDEMFTIKKKNQEYCKPNHRKQAWFDRTYTKRDG